MKQTIDYDEVNFLLDELENKLFIHLLVSDEFGSPTYQKLMTIVRSLRKKLAKYPIDMKLE